LTEILKIGVVDNSKKGDFIGLIHFWAKNEGKNEHFLVLFCIFLIKNERVLSKNCKKLTVFEHFFCTS